MFQGLQVWKLTERWRQETEHITEWHARIPVSPWTTHTQRCLVSILSRISHSCKAGKKHSLQLLRAQATSSAVLICVL